MPDNLKMIREQSLEASMSQSEGGDRSWRDKFNTILKSIEEESFYRTDFINYFGRDHSDIQEWKENQEKIRRTVLQKMLGRNPAQRIYKNYKDDYPDKVAFTETLVKEIGSLFTGAASIHDGKQQSKRDFHGPPYLRLMVYLMVYTLHDTASWEQLWGLCNISKPETKQRSSDFTYRDPINPGWVQTYIIEPVQSIIKSVIPTAAKRDWLKNVKQVTYIQRLKECCRTAILNEIIAILDEHGLDPCNHVIEKDGFKNSLLFEDMDYAQNTGDTTRRGSTETFLYHLPSFLRGRLEVNNH